MNGRRAVPPGRSEQPLAPSSPARGRFASVPLFDRYGAWLVGVLFIVAIFLAYQRVWQAGFIWDDDQHVTENPCVIGPLGFRQIWTTHAARICPLVISCFHLQHILWGLNPLPFHLVNVAFHTGSAIVLWRALSYLKVAGAPFGAALWALHPVQVESVAWVTELKNTQSCFFYLLAVLFFLRSHGSDNAARRSAKADYPLSILFGALAMASKSSTVILPIVLGLCAWYARRLSWQTVFRLLPFFLLAAAASALSLWTQNLEGANDPRWPLTLAQRIALPGLVVWFYLGKLLWPFPLIFIYPRWNVETSNLLTFLPTIGLVALCLLPSAKAPTRMRASLFALRYFVAALLPVLGLLTHFFLRYSFVGDHFQYLASIGPLALAGAGIATLLERWNQRRQWVSPLCFAAIISSSAFLTWRHSAAFRDDETLWRETLRLNPRAAIAQNNLGSILMNKGEIDDAMIHFEEAARLDPKDGAARANIGLVRFQRGEVAAAIADYRASLALQPHDSYAYYHLGNALLQEGRADEAIPNYAAQLTMKDVPVVHHHRGLALSRIGRVSEAITQYQIALRMKPGYADAWFDSAVALERMGELAKAVAYYGKAIEHNPKHVAAHNNLAWLLATAPISSLRDGPRAVALAEEGSSLTNGENPAILDTLAAAYAEAGDFTRAIETAESALRLALENSDSALGDGLRQKIQLYRTHTAFRSEAEAGVSE